MVHEKKTIILTLVIFLKTMSTSSCLDLGVMELQFQRCLPHSFFYSYSCAKFTAFIYIDKLF